MTSDAGPIRVAICFLSLLHACGRRRWLTLWIAAFVAGMLAEIGFPVNKPIEYIALSRVVLWPNVLYISLRTVDRAGLSIHSACFTAGLLGVLHAAPYEMYQADQRPSQWILCWLGAGATAGLIFKAASTFGDADANGSKQQVILLFSLPAASLTSSGALYLVKSAANAGLDRVLPLCCIMMSIVLALTTTTVVGTRLPMDPFLLLAPAGSHGCCLMSSLFGGSANLSGFFDAVCLLPGSKSGGHYTWIEASVGWAVSMLFVLGIQWRLQTLGSLRWAKRSADVLDFLEQRSRERREQRLKEG